MPDLRVAVVGVGGIARRVHIPTLVAMPECKLTTLVDINTTVLAQVAGQFNVPRRFASVDEFLAKPEVDCAFVVTGPDAHAGPVVSLLRAGLDVFCEKPLARNLKDVRAMVQATADADRLLMAGFNRRFMPVYNAAKDAFADRQLELLSIEKNKGGNEYRALVSDGIHMVDAMRWYCGEPVEVRAWSRCAEDEMHEETIVANIRFDSGALGILAIHRNGGKWLEKAELYGEGCTAIVDAADHAYIASGGREEVVSVGAWSSLADRLGFTQEFQHFLECVRERKTPINDGADALRTHELVSEIYARAGLPPL